MAVISNETFESAFVRAVQEVADSLREEYIRKAVDDFESRLREEVLRKAVNLTSYYDMRRVGDNLTLTVRTDFGR